MAERRHELGLSQAAAAKAANVHRNTWTNWEKGTAPEEFNFAGIERALRWERGSVSAILGGGDPTPIPEASVTAIPARPDGDLPPDDDFVRELRLLNLSPGALEALIRAYWDDVAREQERIEDKWRTIAQAAGG